MKPFRQSPDIEPLSELSWKRVEHGIFEKLDVDSSLDFAPVPSKRQPWVLGAAGLVAAAAAVFLFVLSGTQETTTESPTYTAHNSVQRSRVVTQASASEVTVGDASIQVDPNSAIWIDNSNDAVEVTLERGGVRLKVAPRQDRDPVSVLAGNVRIEVMGTEFGVFRSEANTQVIVYEGIVSIIADGKRSEVVAGQSWPPAVEKKRRKSRRSKRAQASSEESPAQPEQAPSAHELYENAAQLESSAPDAAIALYRQLAANPGPWAANALYAQARLEMARGNGDASRALLHKYVRKYPKGSNLQDAQELLAGENSQ